MRSRREKARFLLLLLGFLPIVGIAAQDQPAPAAGDTRRSCDGDTVTTVQVRSHAPSSPNLATNASRETRKVLGVPYEPTRPSIIAAYLRLAGGRVCSEFERRESERLLRAQPFISSATVRAIPDGPGHVRIEVDVVDELPLIVGGSASRGTVSSLLLGTQNLRGLGISEAESVERGFAYRNGFGIGVIKYAMFGRPDFMAIDAQRTPLGDAFSFEVAEPFLTDLQVRAFHAHFSTTSDYYGVTPFVGDPVSLYVRRTTYDAGWVTRIAKPSGRGAIGLLGLVVLGEDVRTGANAVIVSDSGFVSAPASAIGTYAAFASTRVAAIGGLRALRFETVQGFDALTAAQDMGVGVQVDLLAGPSIWASRGSSDVFLASDVYAGVGSARSFLVARGLAEVRGNHESHTWDGVVVSSRLAWYGRPTEARTETASIELSGVQKLSFPLQLSFRDADGGLPGFAGSTWSGGQRVIARVEERRVVKLFTSRADFGVAVFADGGKLWAGDVPYGVTTEIAGSAGVSLLAAYPAGGKRMYRVDLAVPFNPQGGGRRLELRLSSNDRTRLLWAEPRDVAAARTGSVPVSLMKW